MGSNEPMVAICGALSSQVEAPVLDKTGLTGAYNFTLQFGREWSARDPESYPAIFTALQEQLGLKLEAVKEAVPNLVVDHIAKPTETEGGSGLRLELFESEVDLWTVPVIWGSWLWGG